MESFKKELGRLSQMEEAKCKSNKRKRKEVIIGKKCGQGVTQCAIDRKHSEY